MPPALPPAPSIEDQKEDRFRIVLGVATAMMLVSALSCCCLGSALVSSTDDGHQTHSRRHRP